MIRPSPLTRRPFTSSIIINPHCRTLLQLISRPISFINLSPIVIRLYSSSLYISPISYPIPVHYITPHQHIRSDYIIRRRTDYYQLDRNPPSEDPLRVQLLSPPISRNYYSSSAAQYHLLFCHRLSSGSIKFH